MILARDSRGRLTGTKTHGRRGALRRGAYASWNGMVQRTTNPNDARFADYGGRGIRMCDRWRKSFEAFLADMGDRPTPEHSLDRIDVNGNYEPGNCRWATRKEQQRNQRGNVRLTHNGETLCIAEWAERLGIEYCVIETRLRRGWSVERALSKPRYSRAKAASP